MGYNAVVINDALTFSKSKYILPKALQLSVGNDIPSLLQTKLNPCSIDLQIADSGFLIAKRRSIDPQSIEHISKATSLWKEITTHHSRSKNTRYFKLRPGRTVLTCTKERIKIPDDCAGKIEIKSTYARLSLSITSGDFCNPGYYGHFPLEITNHGKHSVVIHEGETMAQLMLVPLSGPVLVDYSTKATYKNPGGYDDGTPYTFWRERSIKSIRQSTGAQPLIDLYNRVLSKATSQNTADIPGFKERFTDSFLTFCQRKMHKKKFQRTSAPDLSKLVHSYINREKNLKKFYSFKWIAAILSGVGFLTNLVLSLLPNESISSEILAVLTSCKFLVPAFIFVAILIGATIILFVKLPKAFCTFEGYDIDADISEMQEVALKS